MRATKGSMGKFLMAVTMAAIVTGCGDKKYFSTSVNPIVGEQNPASTGPTQEFMAKRIRQAIQSATLDEFTREIEGVKNQFSLNDPIIDGSGYTPLIFLANQNVKNQAHEELLAAKAEILLQNGAFVNQALPKSEGFKYVSPMTQAVRKNNVKLVETLLKFEADPNTVSDLMDNSVFYIEVRNKRLQVAKTLMASPKFDFSYKNNLGKTQISETLENGRMEMFKELVEKGGADLSAPVNEMGETALELILNQLIRSPKVLKDKTLYNQAKDALDFYTSKVGEGVFQSELKKNVKSVESMIKLVDTELEVLEILIAKGMDVNMPLSDGRTPLALAKAGIVKKDVSPARKKLIELLENKGANI